ncbi:MAG: XRE family transcriptional regulator [Terricaulis sp.]
MTNLLDHSLVEVGERLRIARETAKFTQAKAAAALEIARTTLLAIEQGQRRPRLDELQQLAGLYGTSVNALLRRESVHVDLIPRFRKAIGEGEPAIDDAARLLADLVQAEVELEGLLGLRRPQNLPPERPILRGDVRVQAEHDASELRQWLGISTSPVFDAVDLMEMQIGVRVYIRKLDSKISGLFAYDDAVGACVLLNASHRRDRRGTTAIHELGHIVSTRRMPEALHDGYAENSREERYANAFASAFLMPTRAVYQKFAELTAGAPRLTRRHIIILAHSFGVGREAFVRRLEDLDLTKEGSWDWFSSNGGITDEQARLVLGDRFIEEVSSVDAVRPSELRLNQLAFEAWRKDLLSEGQIARLLHRDRVEIREIFDGFDAGESGDDDAPKIDH